MNIGNNNKKPNKASKVSKAQSIMICVICLIVIIIAQYQAGSVSKINKTPKVEYSEFQDDLENGRIDTVYIDSANLLMRYTLLNEETKDMTFDERNLINYRTKEMKITNYPSNTENFLQYIVLNNAQIAYNDFGSSIGGTVALYILQFLPMIIFMYFIFKAFKVETSAFKGKQTSLSSESITDISFDDIIGHDEAIKDIKDALKIMTNVDIDNKMKVKPPRGILLIGPPGTGKTMIAKAMAHEAGMKFFYVDSSAIIDRFVGMGAKNIRDSFEEARKNQPCILFFDEIDAIGGKRNVSFATSEHQQTLNALLQELDGFKPNDKVYMMAATNMFESLDPALVRAGRFDRKIVINPPRDAETRLKMLKHYLDGVMDETVNLELISRQLAGFSGADIAQICNEAKMIAIQHDKEVVNNDYLEEAIDKTLFNGNRTKNNHEEDLKLVAYHECGHALSMLLNNLPIARISIIPNTSGIGGMVVQQDRETAFYTKSYIKNNIKSFYSGRIAEELIFGGENITSGASNDLQQAEKLVNNYMKDFGFDDEFGLIDIDDKEQRKRKAEFAKSLYNEARNELQDNIEVLKILAEEVIKRETIDGAEFTEMFNSIKSGTYKNKDASEEKEDAFEKERSDSMKEEKEENKALS